MQIEWRSFADFSTEQLYQMLRFRQAIFVVEQACAYPDLDGLDRRAEHLLVHEGKPLVGCLRVIPYTDERRVAIGRVAVGDTARRQGLARSMMAEALARCAGAYPDYTIILTAQTYLIPFYESLGFQAISEPFDDYGLMHVEMALQRTKG